MELDGSKLGTEEFTRALRRLKQRGSALLVVGNVSPAVHRLACRQLMGDFSIRRQRLFVTTDGTGVDRGTNTNVRGTDADVRGTDADVRGTIVDEATSSDHVIEHTTSCRSATGAESGCSTIGVDASTHETVRSPTSLLAAIIDTLREIEHEGEPLTPGELRVCVDSLFGLIESNDRAVLLRLVRYTAIATRRRQGIVHIHLPVARETEHASLFEPLVDAVVELRIEGGVPQQRWHLIDSEITSDWTDLNE